MPILLASFIFTAEPPKNATEAAATVKPGQVKLVLGVSQRRSATRIVFLVNKSKSQIELSLKRGDIQLRLEAWDEKQKRWIIAQPDFFPSVAVSLPQLEVRPGQVRSMIGWHPQDGPRRKLRYRIHAGEKLATPSFEGRIAASHFIPARFSLANLRQGDLALLRTVLFHPRDVPFDVTPDHRYAAIQRLEELPKKEALPLLRFLLDTEDAEGVSLVVRALHQHDPAFIESKLEVAMREGRLVQAHGIAAALTDKPLQSQQLIDQLHQRSLDSDSKLQPLAIQLLARSGGNSDERQKKTLRAVRDDRRNRSDVRRLAKLELMRLFGKQRVEIRLISNRNQFLSQPIEFAIRNTGTKPIEFSYQNPDELFTLHLQEGQVSDYPARLFVPLLRRRRTAPLSTALTKVYLPPGGSLSLSLQLSDFFDRAHLPRFSNRAIRVLVQCRIPGEHTIGQITELGRIR